MGIQFNKTPLAVDQKNYATRNVNAYIIYDLDNWPRNPFDNFTFNFNFIFLFRFYLFICYVHDPYARVCVPDKVKNINVKVFHLMLWVNEKIFLVQHE